MTPKYRALFVAGLLLASSGCAAHLYAHRTIEGAPFRFQGLPKVTEGMSAEEVREALGSPLEVKESGDTTMWRYFERANPRWCDGGSAKAVAPEYSIQATLVFRAGTLVIKDVKQSGDPAFP